MADHGSLLAYSPHATLNSGATTWHAVDLSEAHALRSVAEGGMVLDAPDGHPIRLRYERQIEHADGNWTWIGQPEGSRGGQEAILTFGDKAVFGSIPNDKGLPFEITSKGGRTWLVETDVRKLAGSPTTAVAGGPDVLNAPDRASGTSPTAMGSALVSALAASVPSRQASATQTSDGATVDLVLGYSSGLKTRLGGFSQVKTRLNFLVDVANQAFSNSHVGGRLRLVRTVQVNYADTTTNRSALFDLSGLQCSTVASGQLHLPDGDVSCNASSVPAGLAPLIAARNQFGADLVSLVRDYKTENQTCGVAWLIGGGQQPITASSAAYGLSVISDSAGGICRTETLAHEIGHNLGLAHDRTAAAGDDDTNTDNDPLDPGEYGRYGYSFGYSTGAGGGNFYTIMAIPTVGQTAYRVFSNPRLTSCGGLACGETNVADNAQTLIRTMPAVAAFRAAKTQVMGVDNRGDFNGDGKSDILWRNTVTGANSIWLSGNSATTLYIHSAGTAWVVGGVGDFNGDGRSDVLWRNANTGSNSIWLSGNYRTAQATSARETAWEVAGIADFNGDGKSDILWRNAESGSNVIWKSGRSGSAQAVHAVAGRAWIVVGVGDFNGDHKADILWRNVISGSNAIWRSANYSTQQAINAATDLNWVIAGVADFNGDGRADVFWRNVNSGANSVWLSAFRSNYMPVHSASTTYNVAGFGDFNGDHKADVLWRNASSGANIIWRSANISTAQSVSTVSNLQWVPAG
ncbi:reprolysin-like metallopeptidase [Cognatiluteimonas telluris]|jgi:hypothetical protein|uniref:reprolysin-like metallopeptidase n=1 Tax=Cognatiluteimonas telluris TaxID=1104775 RepID=UPI00140CD6C3|nr:FG-GAP-like repeat-containing protein [Lysobacter telluris]